MLSVYLATKETPENIALNHRFISALKDFMNVYVRYEYNKMFKPTTKKKMITEPWLG